jgi:hypothetical protein
MNSGCSLGGNVAGTQRPHQSTPAYNCGVRPCPYCIQQIPELSSAAFALCRYRPVAETSPKATGSATKWRSSDQSIV